MLLFLFLLLCSYDVKCEDENSYYVIEMPAQDPPVKKPFQVYWNVPTVQCKSKRVPFENLSKYGIFQNKDDSFRGEKISILYDPGLFPALLKNETSGKFRFRNGGVPQQGNLEKHLEIFRTMLDQSVPNEEFSGVGIIDFESWRPVFRQNFGVLEPYKDISYEIERKNHRWWPKPWIQQEAKQRFEESARLFMQNTLSIAKQMRPRALWGYYGFPYCFNMANNHMYVYCADNVSNENDQIHWLWAESTALYPSIYSPKSLTASQLAGLIQGRVDEAARVKRGNTPILPYFWFRYRDHGYLSETDLNVALSTLYKSSASGFIIWGSSNDVNTYEKCKALHTYLELILGPAIAKYTLKREIIEDSFEDNASSLASNINVITTKPIINSFVTGNNIKTIIDTDYHWMRPENYTHDIEKFVEEELGPNNSSDHENVDRIKLKSNDSILLDKISKHSYDKSNNSESTEFNTRIIDNNYISKETTTQNIPKYDDDYGIESIVNTPIYTSTENLLNNHLFDDTTLRIETSTYTTTILYDETTISTNIYDSTTNIYDSSTNLINDEYDYEWFDNEYLDTTENVDNSLLATDEIKKHRKTNQQRTEYIQTTEQADTILEYELEITTENVYQNFSELNDYDHLVSSTAKEYYIEEDTENFENVTDFYDDISLDYNENTESSTSALNIINTTEYIELKPHIAEVYDGTNESDVIYNTSDPSQSSLDQVVVYIL